MGHWPCQDFNYVIYFQPVKGHARFQRLQEACEIQVAQTYLEIVRIRGERRLELRRVYRNLRNSLADSLDVVIRRKMSRLVL